MKVFTDPNCYITKRIVYGIADKRRPNSKKPLYVKKTIRIPTAYIVNGLLICHPDYLAAVQRKMANIMTKQLDKMAVSLFGLSQETNKASLTMNDLAEAWNKVK